MSALLKNRYLALTRKFGRRVNVLTTKVKISLPYHPEKDPDSVPPAQIECVAIWDTGATNSVITKNLVKKIGVVSTGVVKVTNTTSKDLRNSYIVNVTLPNYVTLTYLKVADCEDVIMENADENAEMLIGMDVIGAGDFAVTHDGDNTVMSFIMPPVNTIDFVPLSISENRNLENAEKFELQKEVRSIHQPSKNFLRARRKKERQNKKKGHHKH